MAAPLATAAPVISGVMVQGLGPLDGAVLASFRYRESLGAPFEGMLDLRSDAIDVDLGGLLGKPVTVAVPLPAGGERHFNGICLEAEQTGTLGDLSSYRLVLVPWIRLLDLAADCRIFQEKSAKEIVEAVCAGLGFTDYRTSGVIGDLPPMPFCVQYDESHLNFVHRLVERFGIWYHAEHGQGGHTIVFADSNSSAKPFPGYEKIHYAASDAEAADTEHVFRWSSRRRLESGTVVLRDYTYTDPDSSLEVQDSASHSYPHGDLERFEYPGLYAKKAAGSQLARVRLREHTCRERTFVGAARCYGLAAGSTFKLDGHPRKDQNSSYLVTAVDFLLEPAAAAQRGDSTAGAFACTCSFEAIPVEADHCPRRTARIPRIAGHQTALVVGPAGQDPKTPYTDDYGSIRVQFRWDRQGQDDEKSSCWIRYQQFAAGPQWGAVFVPRIGCEVAVIFEGGDPDRPLAIGSLYNQNNRPPLSLPGEATRFHIQDDGGNYLTLDPDAENRVITIYSPTDTTRFRVGKT